MHALLQEIVKYNGSNNLGIKFMQQNNCPGFLILCPSSRSAEWYTSELVEKMVLLIQFCTLFQRAQNVMKEKQHSV